METVIVITMSMEINSHDVLDARHYGGLEFVILSMKSIGSNILSV